MFLGTLRHNAATREISSTGATTVFDDTVSRSYSRIRRVRITHDGEGLLRTPTDSIGDWTESYDDGTSTLTVNNANAVPTTDVQDILRSVEYVGDDEVAIEAEASFQAYLPINLTLLSTASSSVTANGIVEVCAPQDTNTVFIGVYSELTGGLDTHCIFRVTTSLEGETIPELVFAPDVYHSSGAVFMAFGPDMVVWSYIDSSDDSYLRAARYVDGSWTVGTQLLVNGAVRYATTHCPTSTLSTVAYIGTKNDDEVYVSDSIRRVEVDLESEYLMTLGSEIPLVTNRIALINDTHYLVTEGTDTMHIIEASTGTIVEHTIANPATESGEWVNLGTDGLVYRCFGDGTDYSIYTCDPMADTPAWTLYATYADDDYRIEDVAALTDESDNLQLTVLVQSKTVTADNFIAYATVVDGGLVLDSVDVNPRYTIGASVSYQKWIRGNAPLGGAMYVYREAESGQLDTLQVQGRGDGTNSISVRLVNVAAETIEDDDDDVVVTPTPTATPTAKSSWKSWMTWVTAAAAVFLVAMIALYFLKFR